jgi:uncharacterized protein YegL
MDCSGSIRQTNFENTKRFIKIFASKLVISENAVNITLMHYDGNVKLSIPFTYDLSTFAKNVDILVYNPQSSGTYLECISPLTK